jgi:hypothetical protein
MVPGQIGFALRSGSRCRQQSRFLVVVRLLCGFTVFLPNEKPAPCRAGLRRGEATTSTIRSSKLTATYCVGAQPSVHRRAGRSSEIRQHYKVLQVVGEPVQQIGEAAIIGVSFLRIAHFQNPARRIVSVEVDGQWIVRPLAYFVRQRRHILRECAHMIHIGRFRVGLRIAGAAFRAVIPPMQQPPPCVR